MRKEDIDDVDKFIEKNNIDCKDDLLNLCLSIYSSGWCDGSNDYIEDYDDEEE